MSPNILGVKPSGTVEIAVLNQCTVLTDAQVKAAIPDLQTQITRDFAPAWGTNANLTFFSAADRAKVPASSYWLAVLDNSDQAGALGYHDLSPTGTPMAKVFAKTDQIYKLSWTVTASHELLEMLADPNVNLLVLVQNSDTAGVLYPVEVGDPVESDAVSYMINATRVTNFITPAWLEYWRPAGSARFDHLGLLHQPLQMLAGGYVSTLSVTLGGGWTQKTMPQDGQNHLVRPRLGARTELRALPRHRWIKSELSGDPE